MSEEPLHTDDIDKYLMGQMGVFEQGLFEHKLAQDDELKLELAIRKKAMEMIEWQRANQLKEYIKRNTPHKRVLTFWQQVAVYSSVACLLFFVLSWAMLTLYFPENNLAINQNKTTQENKTDITDSNGNNGYTAPEITNDQIVQSPNTPSQVQDSAATVESMNNEVKSDIASAQEQDVPPAAASSNASDEYVIKSDALVLDTVFYAASFILNTDRAIASRAPEAESKAKPIVKGNKTTSVAEDTAAIPMVKNATLTLKVEFWQSPINYRGYKFNGMRVQLYGIQNPQKVKFKVINDELYMLNQGQVFHIIKEDRYNSYWPETDKAVLKMLK